MPTIPPPKKSNPLSQFMRQPKIYISLPSKGEYWTKGSLEITETGEYPVYSMTAKDELVFKTPDALLNGQAMAEVIQSCIPNIKNAWQCPSIDFDLILIAIRLATYGERMPIKHKIPNIDEEVDYDLDLRILLDQLQNNHWVEQIVIDENFIIYTKPLTYKHISKVSMKAIETSKILRLVNDDSISEDKKLEIFNSSFSNLTAVTVDLISDAVFKVYTGTEEVTDKDHIKEFVHNADKDLFDRMNKHMEEMKNLNNLKPLKFTTTAEQQAAGAPETYEIPISFNESDFFAQGF